MSHPDNPSSCATEPFGELSPAVVLDALDAAGWQGDGRALQLNSFENRVWLVPLEAGGAVVAKFYRPARWSNAQILEEHAFAAEMAAADVPVATALPGADGNTLFQFSLGHASTRPAPVATGSIDPAPAWRYAVFDRRPGRAPDIEDPAVMRWIGRYLGRIHTVGCARPFEHRLSLDPVPQSRAAIADVRATHLLPPSAEAAWGAAATALLEPLAACLDRAGPLTRLRTHGDCHLGNVLWTESGPHFVDLDDAVNAPAVQDLWMLLAGDADTAASQTRALLEGYESVRDFDDRELRLIEVLRATRMLHYSAWIARRWHDPAFPAAFPWFGDAAYWSDQVARIKDQTEILRELALNWPRAWH